MNETFFWSIFCVVLCCALFCNVARASWGSLAWLSLHYEPNNMQIGWKNDHIRSIKYIKPYLHRQNIPVIFSWYKNICMQIRKLLPCKLDWRIFFGLARKINLKWNFHRQVCWTLTSLPIGLSHSYYQPKHSHL